jgi:Zn finger protein HypA/HybF involved in hydrogenase expression
MSMTCTHRCNDYTRYMKQTKLNDITCPRCGSLTELNIPASDHWVYWTCPTCTREDQKAEDGLKLDLDKS